jgi:translocation and assembly module TamB
LTGNGQQIFSIGKRLSSHVLLSYEQAMGKAESLVKLTWSLSQQVSLIGRAGSDNAIDILYTLSLGKPAALRQANMGRVGCSGGVNCAE